MIHAAKIAMELHSRLPANEAPEYTDGYDGFYHLLESTGTAEQAKLYYIIRDFDRESFEKRKAYLTNVVKELQAAYGENRIALDLRDQYYNMKEKIEPVKHIVDVAYEAMTKLNIEPIIKPIRGGTDGSQLSYMGLPTPNIFTGGENYHGKFEYVSVDNMVLATKVIVEIAQLFEQRGK
jgi:tripeptide aminopeptidase